MHTSSWRLRIANWKAVLPSKVRSYIDACLFESRYLTVSMSPVRQASKKGESYCTTLHAFNVKGHPEVAYSSCRSYCRCRNHFGSRTVRSLAVRLGLLGVCCFRDVVCSNVMLSGIKPNDKVVRVVVSIRLCDEIGRVSASRRALTSLMARSALKTLVTMR